MTRVLPLLLALACASTTQAVPRHLRLPNLPQADLDARAQSDARLLLSYSRGVDRLLQQIAKQDGLFERPRESHLSPDERWLVLALFEQTLSYVVALDSMASFHSEFWRIDITRDAVRHTRHVTLALAAECLKARVGLALVDRTLNKPQFESLLDEKVPSYGLPAGSYAQLKWHVVHTETLSRILSLHNYHGVLAKTLKGKLQEDEHRAAVVSVAQTSYNAIKRTLLQHGAKLFAGNALDILKDSHHRAWFPVQAQVAELIGDTKVRRLDTMLIDLEQVRSTVPRSQPGDIIVERRNWYLSNVALPGFWPHVALWLGSPEELAAFLDNDPAVRGAYGGPFSLALRKKYPDAWKQYSGQDEEGHTHRLVEALSEGVVFTSAEHSVRCDYAAALRPKLPKIEIARAIERAFSYVGRPYDFDFDFFTDAALVCSELVYKSYEPRRGARGLQLPLDRIAGRMTLGPNTIVRLFDRDFGKESQQLDFVWFLDGREKEGDATWSDLTTFRASHRRLKWDIAQK